MNNIYTSKENQTERRLMEIGGEVVVKFVILQQTDVTIGDLEVKEKTKTKSNDWAMKAK